VTSVFGNDYAGSYDALYAEKDYAAECDLLEDIFRTAARPVRSVLDLGCGTGRHSVELAGRGYDLVGVDRSPAMLERARARAQASTALEHQPEFVEGDVRDLSLAKRFDAVLCMFAVLGYQIEAEGLRATLAGVRRHLEPGGLFIFDVWYGPAVEAIGPEVRTKVVRDGLDEVERTALGVLEADKHVCSVSYRVTRRRAGMADATTFETHRMRYFYEADLADLLAGAGLTLRSVSAFPDVENPPSASSWNVLAVAAG
jgi:SAM-dependent methyltransferase